jgi:hypothetical protein
MRQPGRGASLAQRTLSQLVCLVVAGRLGQEHLFDRDLAAQHLIAGEPNPTHAADTDPFAEPVSTADKWRVLGHFVATA